MLFTVLWQQAQARGDQFCSQTERLSHFSFCLAPLYSSSRLAGIDIAAKMIQDEQDLPIISSITPHALLTSFILVPNLFVERLLLSFCLVFSNIDNIVCCFCQGYHHCWAITNGKLTVCTDPRTQSGIKRKMYQQQSTCILQQQQCLRLLLGNKTKARSFHHSFNFSS